MALTPPPNAASVPPAAEAAGPAETVIERRDGWKALNLSELWTYRELLFFLAWRDVKVRYKQTALGAAWAVLQPLLMMVVFTILFAGLAKVDTGEIPYYLFVYIGLLPWTYVAVALGASSNSVVESERLITKVYFPRLLIPFGSIVAAMVDFAIGAVVLIGLLIYCRIPPTWTWGLIPFFLIGFVLVTMGAGTLLSALNVQYRDFRYAIPFLVQIWMFATPSIFLIMDTKTFNPLRLNPLTGLIAGFRAAILGGEIPWWDAAWGFAVAGVLFAVGCSVFRRMEASFSDII